ncbi:hypothetical protein D3C83_98200 [compost metagenome]
MVGLWGIEKSIPALSPKHQIRLLNCAEVKLKINVKVKNVKSLFIELVKLNKNQQLAECGWLETFWLADKSVDDLSKLLPSSQ